MTDEHVYVAVSFDCTANYYNVNIVFKDTDKYDFRVFSLEQIVSSMSRTVYCVFWDV